MTDVELAARLADTAGRVLVKVRQSHMFDGKALGQAGDQTANEFLVHALRHQRPDDGLLSEESRDTLERLDKSRVWIIDPVDGTREYGEGREDWAVHVALSIDGVASVGAVALPGLGRGAVLRSDGATTGSAGYDGPPRLVVSRFGCEKTRWGAGGNGLCRRQGDGGGARGCRNISPFRRSIRVG